MNTQSLGRIYEEESQSRTEEEETRRQEEEGGWQEEVPSSSQEEGDVKVSSEALRIAPPLGGAIFLGV